jgi:F0F1-type ATP synthase membrane subunit b/b'
VSTQAGVLVKVKKLREESAETALAAASSAVAAAIRARDARKQEITDYRKWRVGRERELYTSVTERTVLLADLEELNATVAGLRDRERELAGSLADLEKAVQQAEVALHDAELALQQAEKEVQKMVELDARLSGREALAAERKGEMELEEYTRKSPGPGR